MRQTREKPWKLPALLPVKEKRSKCGRTCSSRSPIERTSYLKVRSDRDSRIQPHPKNACRSVRSDLSFSFRESEKDGRTSRPVLSLARSAKDTQKHPSPSARPVTYHGSSDCS